MYLYANFRAVQTMELLHSEPYVKLFNEKFQGCYNLIQED